MQVKYKITVYTEIILHGKSGSGDGLTRISTGQDWAHLYVLLVGEDVSTRTARSRVGRRLLFRGKEGNERWLAEMAMLSPCTA
jgi:hypothetical protein